MQLWVDDIRQNLIGELFGYRPSVGGVRISMLIGNSWPQRACIFRFFLADESNYCAMS